MSEHLPADGHPGLATFGTGPSSPSLTSWSSGTQTSPSWARPGTAGPLTGPAPGSDRPPCATRTPPAHTTWTCGWRSSTTSTWSTMATRPARRDCGRPRVRRSTTGSARWRLAGSCRSCSEATTPSPGRPPARWPTISATAMWDSSTSTPMQTPPPTSTATWPATARQCGDLSRAAPSLGATSCRWDCAATGPPPTPSPGCASSR